MKMYLFLLISSFNTFGFCHFENKEDKIYSNVIKYLTKRDYINEKTAISDTIVYLPYSNVFDLLKEGEKNDIKLLDSLTKLDENLKFDNFKLKNIGNRKNEFHEIAYFSKPFQNTLLVEIVNCSTECTLDYSKATQMTTSTIYLFYIRKNGKVLKCKKLNFNYD